MTRAAKPGLSPVELVVLQGAAAGETTAETGIRTCRAFTTVQRHRKHILCKLLDPDTGRPARNMTHAVAIAYQTGVLVPPPR